MANQSLPHSSSYRSEIDGLRAFAVLSVVAFHAFPSWLKGGFIGVDIFFVISGFLITRNIFEGLDNGQFSFANFFGRRIRRIFPALILVISCSLLFGWFVLYEDEFRQLGKHIASSSIFITNFILVNENGYFDNPSDTKPMLHLWSLAVEEQFYIFWPLILWIAWKHSLNLLYITIFVAITSYIANVVFVSSFPTEIFFYPFGRLWELLVGSVLAWLFLYRSTFFAISSRNANLITIIGLSILLISVFFISEKLKFPSYWAAFPIFGAVLVIISGSKGVVSRLLLTNPIVVWFGLISYPLYLWHWPIFSYLHIIEGGMPNLYVSLSAILVSILFAWLTYKLIEKGIRKRKVSNRLSVTLITLVLFLGILGLLVNFGLIRSNVSNISDISNSSSISGGIKFDFPFAEEELIRLTRQPPSEKKSCLDFLGISHESKIRFCQIKDLNRVPDVALIGDSHSAIAFEGTSYYLTKDHSLSVINLAGRLFSNVIAEPKSSEYERNVYLGGFEVADYLDEHKDIKNIIMISRGFFYLNWAENFSIPNREFSSKEDVFIEGLRGLLERFKDRNIIFVLENPTLNFDPRSCNSNRPIKTISYYLSSADTERERCSISRAEDDLIHLDYIQKVSELLNKYSNVIVLDPRDFLCDQIRCYAMFDQRVVYSDVNHLNKSGSYLQGKQISDAFKRFKSE